MEPSVRFCLTILKSRVGYSIDLATQVLYLLNVILDSHILEEIIQSNQVQPSSNCKVSKNWHWYSPSILLRFYVLREPFGCVYLVLHNFITCVDLCEHHVVKIQKGSINKDPSWYIFISPVTILPSPHKPTTKF